jgi:hypothetical protein
VSSNVQHITALDVHPRIDRSELQGMFGERIINAELVIASDEGGFVLIWKVNFASENDNIRWVDASTAQVLKEFTVHLHHSAETPTYGTQILNDHHSGGITSLKSPDNRIKVFDGLVPSSPLVIEEWDEAYIPTTINYS